MNEEAIINAITQIAKTFQRTHCAIVTPDDNNPLPNPGYIMLQSVFDIDVDVKVVTEGGETVVIQFPSPFTEFPVKVVKVFNTGTNVQENILVNY